METQSLLRKTVMAGIGIYSLTKEKAQDLMGDLVKRGELSQEEGPKFVKAMMQKAEDEVEFLKKMIDTRIEKAISAVKPKHDDEFKKLNLRIDKLTKEIEKLSKK